MEARWSSPASWLDVAAGRRLMALPVYGGIAHRNGPGCGWLARGRPCALPWPQVLDAYLADYLKSSEELCAQSSAAPDRRIFTYFGCIDHPVICVQIIHYGPGGLVNLSPVPDGWPGQPLRLRYADGRTQQRVGRGLAKTSRSVSVPSVSGPGPSRCASSTPMRIAPICSGTANTARTSSSRAAGVNTGHRCSGTAARSGSSTSSPDARHPGWVPHPR